MYLSCSVSVCGCVLTLTFTLVYVTFRSYFWPSSPLFGIFEMIKKRKAMDVCICASSSKRPSHGVTPGLGLRTPIGNEKYEY